MKPITIILAILLLANVVSAIALIDARQKSRHHFVALSKLETIRDELNIEFGQLQLEHATWSDSYQLEQVARQRLGMEFPTPENTVVLRR